MKLGTTLHTRLFERTTRQLRLTEEGRIYLLHCQQALQSLEDAHAALHAGRSIVRGKERISATSDCGRHVLERFDCIILATASGPANDWRFTRGGEVETYTVPVANARETNDGALAREWAVAGK